MNAKNATLEIGGAFVVLPLNKDGFVQWPIELHVDGVLKKTFFDSDEARERAHEWFTYMEYATITLEQEGIERGEEPDDDRIVTSPIACFQLPSFDSPEDAIRYLDSAKAR